MIDEELYKFATRELNSKDRQPELWTRAVALASDDHDEARYLYINLRVEELKEAGTSAPKDDLSQKFPQTPAFETPTPDDDTFAPEPVLIVPELTTPDLTAPNLTTPNLTAPNLTTPNLTTLDLTAIDQKTQTFKTKPTQPVTSFTTGDELDITNRVRDAEQPEQSSSANQNVPVYGAGVLSKSKESVAMAPDGELSLVGDIARTAGDEDAAVGSVSKVLEEDNTNLVSAVESEQVTNKLDPASSIDSIANRAPTYATDTAEWKDSRVASEYFEAHPEQTHETDQTIRLDQPTAGFLEGDEEEHRALDVTTMQTLNPGEINDGNVNPEIDLDQHANQSAAEVEEVIPGYGGSRFYSVFSHRDGRTRAVKLGGSWPATFLTLPWLLYKRLWGTAIVYLALLAMFLAAFVIFGLHFLDAGGFPIQTKLAVAGFCILGFLGLFYIPYKFGNSWVMEKLEQKGFTFNTALAAGNADEARQRAR